MTWKWTALISGVGLLATWSMSTPVAHLPAANTNTPVARAPQATAVAVDIQHEAARLQARLHQAPRFTEPERDPFRFGARRAPVARLSAAPVQAAISAPVPPPPPPLITLDGIAADTVGGQEERTAILKTASGVVLVREGDQVAGQFRVQKIYADAVDLVKLSDDSVLHISLR